MLFLRNRPRASAYLDMAVIVLAWLVVDVGLLTPAFGKSDMSRLSMAIGDAREQTRLSTCPSCDASLDTNDEEAWAEVNHEQWEAARRLMHRRLIADVVLLSIPVILFSAACSQPLKRSPAG